MHLKSFLLQVGDIWPISTTVKTEDERKLTVFENDFLRIIMNKTRFDRMKVKETKWS